MNVTYQGTFRQGKIELKESLAFPEGQQVYVIVPQIDVQTARRKANRWLLDNAGNMLMADEGELQQINGQIVWRFGVFITSSTHAPQGPFDHIDVLAGNGRVVSDAETIIAHALNSSLS
jgi:hypothetical protein